MPGMRSSIPGVSCIFQRHTRTHIASDARQQFLHCNQRLDKSLPSCEYHHVVSFTLTSVTFPAQTIDHVNSEGLPPPTSRKVRGSSFTSPGHTAGARWKFSRSFFCAFTYTSSPSTRTCIWDTGSKWVRATPLKFNT